MYRKGLIIINTGNGKGKTTAAIGVAIRAAGHGLKVLILQFMKGQKHIGELKALTKINLPITIKQFGSPIFLHSKTCESIDIYKAHLGLKAFLEAVKSNSFDLIILDEINMAIDFGLLEIDEVIAIIEQKPPELHLILTGRNAKQAMIDIADLVTEMKEIKHPYNNGIMAQKGIEF
jgi:cob(I)alamin adenosyltransferase